MSEIREYEIVALTEAVSTTHAQTGEPIVLRPGQMGTVLMSFENGDAFEVDFSGRDGIPFAQLTLSADKLMALHQELTEESR
jgi:hypothetical protein